MTATKKMSGWIVTGSATGINLILGLLYSWSVIKAALVSDWGWSNTEATLPYTLCVALLSFMTIFGGRLQDEFGPKRIALIGGFLFGLGILLSAFAGTPFWMMMTFGVVSGVGMGFAYASATPAAIKWFKPEQKGLIAGIVVAGIGLSSVYMAPLSARLLSSHGIEGTFLILGIIAIVFLVGFSFFLNNPPEMGVAASKSSASSQQADVPWAGLLRTKQFYLIWIIYLLSATAGLMLIGHIASITQVQTSSTSGFVMVVVLAIFNTIGRVVGGFLSDKMGRTTALLAVFIVQALTMFLFSYLTTFPLLAIGVAVSGLAYGALFSLFPAITADFFGLKNLGVNYGLIFTSWGIAGIIGPVLAGRVVDMTGSYQISYWVAGSMLVLASLIVTSIKAPKHAC